jgi:hypothetical protein
VKIAPESFVIGDRDRDLLPARQLGFRPIGVKTGHGCRDCVGEYRMAEDLQKAVARRTRFPSLPKKYPAYERDQLGDFIVSIPAIRRLKELLPKANFVGLLSPVNADLAWTLDLFSEIIIIDHREDEWEQRAG